MRKTKDGKISSQLTEDWKEGKLGTGVYYYILMDNDTVQVALLYCNSNDDFVFEGYDSEDIKEVLALCDYEELQELRNSIDYFKYDYEEAMQGLALYKNKYEASCERVKELLKEYETLYHRAVGEIYNLRSLLKECKEFLYMYPTSEIDSGDLYRKVIDILGEDNE